MRKLYSRQMPRQIKFFKRQDLLDFEKALLFFTRKHREDFWGQSPKIRRDIERMEILIEKILPYLILHSKLVRAADEERRNRRFQEWLKKQK